MKSSLVTFKQTCRHMWKKSVELDAEGLASRCVLMYIIPADPADFLSLNSEEKRELHAKIVAWFSRFDALWERKEKLRATYSIGPTDTQSYK